MNAKMTQIDLFLIDGEGYRPCYARVNGELLLIGGVDSESQHVYPGDQMRRNADLKKLDEFCGATTWDYDHALSTARELLVSAPQMARRVRSVSEIEG